jgi:hypothetical protein
MHRTADSFYASLLWSPFLAWVPLAFAVGAFARAWRSFDLLVVTLQVVVRSVVGLA